MARKKRKYKILYILVAAIAGLFPFSFIAKRIAPPHPFLSKRALVLVVENLDSSYPNPFEDFDPGNRLIDYFGEDYISARYMNAAVGYGKIVYLTDSKATYSNFKSTLLHLQDEGYPVDIILHLHGSPDIVYFTPETGVTYDVYGFASPFPTREYIAKDLSPYRFDIGYVYQTLCSGHYMNDMWIRVGAKAVVGAAGTNDMVILSPELFLRRWGQGYAFDKAVTEAYKEEVKFWQPVARIVPGWYKNVFLQTYPEAVEGSRMVFAGNSDITATSLSGAQ